MLVSTLSQPHYLGFNICIFLVRNHFESRQLIQLVAENTEEATNNT